MINSLLTISKNQDHDAEPSFLCRLSIATPLTLRSLRSQPLRRSQLVRRSGSRRTETRKRRSRTRRLPPLSGKAIVVGFSAMATSFSGSRINGLKAARTMVPGGQRVEGNPVWQLRRRRVIESFWQPDFIMIQRGAVVKTVLENAVWEGCDPARNDSRSKKWATGTSPWQSLS